MRRRHTYGTTGCRLHLDVRAHFPADATLFDDDPKVFPGAGSRRTRAAMMGDIVHCDADQVELAIEVASPAPIERIEVRNGTGVVALLRPYGREALGSRLRVIWSGAEYRGRGRQSSWTGRARFGGVPIRAIRKINAWNLERRLEQTTSDTVEFDAITTGNFGGFDAWLDEDSVKGGEFQFVCNHGTLRAPMDEIGLDDHVLDCGGLARQVRVFRLPETNPHREMRERISVPLHTDGDNPLWVCVTTEDGFQAWSSPIFVYR
ncbi:MAG: hypothetical protein R3E48_09560 [Burkholderiaceae bacterium]